VAGHSREISDEVMWRRDGSSVPVRYMCAPMRDGDQIVGATLLFEEVGEGQRAREELARLSYLSALILTWAGEGIFGVDARGRFTFANPAAGVMLGYEPDDLVGQSVHELIHHTRADGEPLPEDQSLLLAAYRDNDVYHVGDDLFWRSDGVGFPVEYTSTPLREGDTLVGTVVVFKDITERNLAEANLRQTMDDLARSNRELEQFAYIVSHDLQEPLRMVAGYMDLLVRRYSDRLDDDAREFIDYAVDGARRMRRLIEDLLEYSRVGTRGQRLQPVSLDKAVDDALANLQVAIEECGAIITRDQMPTVLGDHAQLAQLYQNLIGNAIKFRGDETPRIYLGAERDGETWRLSVADNGIGIAPEEHERIFVLFQRLHARDEYPGTGIGLAVCRRIVERHGGKLRVQAEEDEGATFHFNLSVAPGITTDVS
jgi:PAS domain S-box-containing protein